MTPALDNLTVCVTSFQRGKFLARAIDSLRAAGIRRVAVALVCPDAESLAIIERERVGDWLSFDCNRVDTDIGCNNTWALAAYLSRTDRIVILHDDDCLTPAFGRAYEETISPFLDQGEGIVAWRAHLLYEDGRRRVTDYFYGETRVTNPADLARVFMSPGRLSLSPIVSVFDRKTVISAAKESEATLTKNECLLRPGMLLGTEIVAHFRHLEKAKRFLFVDEVLALYGSHAGSGTIQAEQGQNGGIARLAQGYDLARRQSAAPAAFKPRRLLIIVTYDRLISDEDTRKRIEVAATSRRFQSCNFDAIEIKIPFSRFKRSIGDLPFLRELIDVGAAFAMPEDVVLYINDDIGLTVDAPARLMSSLEESGGVAICPRRSYPNPRPLVRSVRNCPADGGIDGVAVTPAWWAKHRTALPDFVIGREAWDSVFAILADELVEGSAGRPVIFNAPENWSKSRAFADDVCWHEPHMSPWQVLGPGDSGNAHNRRLALAFFKARGCQQGIDALLRRGPIS